MRVFGRSDFSPIQFCSICLIDAAIARHWSRCRTEWRGMRMGEQMFSQGRGGSAGRDGNRNLIIYPCSRFLLFRADVPAAKILSPLTSNAAGFSSLFPPHPNGSISFEIAFPPIRRPPVPRAQTLWNQTSDCCSCFCSVCRPLAQDA